MNISEEQFETWAQGPAKTESEKCENTERAIRKAIAADKRLSALDTTVFAQGSYKARTNVRQDSDVDICVRYNTSFFDTYPPGKTRKDFGNEDGTLPFHDFKGMVETALQNYFGTSTVKRGNKAINVHANTYRIDADVVPTFEHRRYTGSVHFDGGFEYYSGVAFLPDQGEEIINWPDQSYENGVQKNDATARRYKRIIRILKRLRNEMQDGEIPQANGIASFLIESLVWNTPNAAFEHDTYTADVRYVIAHTFNNTRQDNNCDEWGEVNELKYLFRPSQPWTRAQANQFLDAAWNYVGFT